jgi:hypothetical protein
MVRVLTYDYGLSWTEGGASLAVHAVLVSAVQDVIFLIVVMSIIAALVHADVAADTAILIPLHDILGDNVTFHNICLLS